MASYRLADYEETTWSFNGKAVERKIIVARANCAPAKEVIDQTVALITSECISLDLCDPKIKSYHKHASSYSVKETIPGIGLGCEMVQGSNNVTRRSQVSDAGNFTEATVVDDYMSTTMNNLLATGIMIAGTFFPEGAASNRVCPAI